MFLAPLVPWPFIKTSDYILKSHKKCCELVNWAANGGGSALQQPR